MNIENTAIKLAEFYFNNLEKVTDLYDDVLEDEGKGMVYRRVVKVEYSIQYFSLIEQFKDILNENL